MSSGWGEGGAPEEGVGESAPSGMIPLGDGDYMQFEPEFFQKLLHDPGAVGVMTQRAQEMCETANNMAITQGAEYIVTVQNRSNTTRARARVRPGGINPIKAMVDDAAHSTLLKAMEAHPGDPKPEGEPIEADTPEAPPVEPVEASTPDETS